MAAVNTPYSYANEIDGLTPWERLKNVRSFLVQRTKAYDINLAKQRQYKEKVELEKRKLVVLERQLANLNKAIENFQESQDDTTELELKAIELELKISEVVNSHENAIIESADLEDLMEDTRREVENLQILESRIKDVAYLTRIEGKSDIEMYDLNHPNEVRVRTAIRAQNDIMTVGRLSAQILDAVRRDPAIAFVIDQTLQSPQVMAQLSHVVETAPNRKDIEQIALAGGTEYAKLPSVEEIDHGMRLEKQRQQAGDPVPGTELTATIEQ